MLESRRRISDDLGFDSVVSPSNLITASDITTYLESSGITSVNIYEKYKEHIKSNRGGWVAAFPDNSNTGITTEYVFTNALDNISYYVSYYSSIYGEQSYKVDKSIQLTQQITVGEYVTEIYINTTVIPSSGKINLYRAMDKVITLQYVSKVDSGTTSKLILNTGFTSLYTYETNISRIIYVVSFSGYDTKRCVIYNHDSYNEYVDINQGPVWVYLGKDIKYVNTNTNFRSSNLRFIHAEDRDKLEKLIYFFDSKLTGNLTLGQNIKHLGNIGGSGLNGTLYIPKSLIDVWEGCLNDNSFNYILPYDENDQSPTCPVFSNTLYCNKTRDYRYENIYSDDLVAIKGAKLNNTPLEFLPSTNRIGSYCYYNNYYRTCYNSGLTFPEDLRHIHLSAFYNCTGLNGTINFNDNLLTISGYSFWRCYNLNNTNLVFPSKLLSIGNYTFYSCIGFNGNLTFPDSVNTIDVSAFNGCYNLGYNITGYTYDGTLYIGSGMTFIGELAFYDCNFVNIVSTSSLCREYDKTIYSYSGSILYAIYGAKKYIGTLSLNPESLNPGYEVNVIGNSCFYQNLRTGGVEIPNTVTKINNNSFYRCESITGITFESNSTLNEIQSNAFYYCGLITNDLIIPNSIKIINNGAFEGLGWNTSSISNVLTIGGDFTNIGTYAFKSTNFCQIVWSGETLQTGKTISASAFENMFNLSGTFIIPSGVTNLGDNITNIVGGSGGATIVSHTNSYIVDNNIIYSSNGQYLIGTNKNTSISAPNILTGCTRICSKAFYYTLYTGSLKITNIVNSIFGSAFRGMSGLNYIKFYPTIAPSWTYSTNAGDLINGYRQFDDIGGKLRTVTGYSGYGASAYTICGITFVSDVATLDSL